MLAIVNGRAPANHTLLPTRRQARNRERPGARPLNRLADADRIIKTATGVYTRLRVLRVFAPLTSGY